jgi:hypothetical protein
MVEIGLFWTLLLLVGTVTLAVCLVKLLFPASGGLRSESQRGAGTLGFIDRPHPEGGLDRDKSDKPSG